MKNEIIFCKLRLLVLMFLFLYIMFMLHKVGKGHGRCFLLFSFLYMTVKEVKGWCIIALFKSESTLKVGYLLRQIRDLLTDSCTIFL